MPVIGISLPTSCHTDSSSVACQCPSVPALSAHPYHLPVPHQCHISVPISATPMPHISAHLSCLLVSLISVSQCHLSMPVSATYQCCRSVPPNSVSQCHLTVPVSVAYQCHL
ncbi:unnamed protein product [Staurois parvus]|uniref:Uncharacterized protein n=1 Tax=Staurois parvus TaxID=386267 RepID=A0ABN9BLD1_9NEOB|nr:unnamed protein product [Staurois parvus]